MLGWLQYFKESWKLRKAPERRGFFSHQKHQLLESHCLTLGGTEHVIIALKKQKALSLGRPLRFV